MVVVTFNWLMKKMHRLYSREIQRSKGKICQKMISMASLFSEDPLKPSTLNSANKIEAIVENKTAQVKYYVM